MTQPGFGLQVDIAGFSRALDDIGRRALPAAARETLNRAAFDAQGALTRHAVDAFDRPKRFTTHAFVVDRAKRVVALDELSSAVRAKGAQAAYLRLQIEGGTRTAADPGVRGASDVFTQSVRTDKHGGIPQNFIRALTSERRAEQGKRAVFAAHRDDLMRSHELAQERAHEAEAARRDAARDTVQAATLDAFGSRGRKGASKRLDRALRASTARDVYRAAPSYERAHKPGIFFGVVNGVKGYWRRPKRTAPAGKRRKGVRQVADTGAPTLLLKVQEAAKYKPLFRYNEVIAASYTRFGAQAEFARELERQIAHLHAKAAAGPPAPTFRMPFAGLGR